MRSASLAPLALGFLVACPAAEPEPDPQPLTAEAGPALRAFAGEELRFDGSRSTGASLYAWTFGDGQSTSVSAEATARHVYEAPGHFTAGLEVFDQQGRSLADTVQVTVTLRPAVESTASSSGLAEADGRLFVAMPDHDVVAVVERASGSLLGWIPTCAGPVSVAVGPAAADPVGAVSCEGDDKLLLFDPEGTPPADPDAVLPDSRPAVPPELVRETVELPYGSRPRGVVVDSRGATAFVALQGTGSLAQVPLLPGAGELRVEPVLADARGVSRIGETKALTRHRSPDDSGRWISWPTDGGPHYGLLAFEPGPDSDTTTRGVPTYLQQLAVSPDGRRAALPGTIANIDRGLWRDGRPLTHETVVRAMVALVDVDVDSPDYGAELGRLVLDDRGLASAAAFSPLGDFLYVATLGVETVEVLDAYTLQRVGALSGVCGGPDALWVSPDGGELWVSCPLSRELVAFSLLDLAGPRVELARIDLRPGGTEVLDPEVLRGKRLFHRSADPRMTRSGYLSCASCHLDGDQDARTWDFTDRGEGLRNTISLMGRRGLDHGPVHWSGNFDEIQDFENDVRGPQQGAGFLSDEDFLATEDPLGEPKAGLSEDLDALAAYVESLDRFPRSPYRDPDGSFSDQALRGLAVFASPEADCVRCHPAPDYTDSAWLAPGQPLLHDVGSSTEASGGRRGEDLLGLDTPTLRGVWATAPYFHNGSAATLEETLLDPALGGRHGGAAELAPGQVEDLVRFLLELE